MHFRTFACFVAVAHHHVFSRGGSLNGFHVWRLHPNQLALDQASACHQLRVVNGFEDVLLLEEELQSLVL